MAEGPVAEGQVAEGLMAEGPVAWDCQPPLQAIPGEAALDGLVLMFPGQGAQKPRMGVDLLGLPSVKECFVAASDVFGFDIEALVRKGTEAELQDTLFAQATLLTLEIALTQLLRDQGVAPVAVLGFSLGQISALYASGILSLEATLRLSRLRAEAMAQAAAARPGSMCALLGADAATAQVLCTECAQEGVLVIANYNCPGQIVVSGDTEAVRRAQAAWCETGRRAPMLATTGAFHSPLMQDAADKVQSFCERLDFCPASTPLICNTDAGLFDPTEAPVRLARHLTHPVLFQQSLEALASAGAEAFLEAGPGRTLGAFVKRVHSALTRYAVEDGQTLQAFLALIGSGCEPRTRKVVNLGNE
ncbi:MAG: ACP S-malonyltransferase [Coriobacteriaceae bacterium]|jgi:[acyl-carrier-protein] S-malonyltransferase|nr:ACP S-malonyltransferase [Coriobacteriaceae bacterium]